MNDVNTRKRLDFSFSELRYNLQLQKNSPKIEQDGKRSSKQPEFTFLWRTVFVAFAVVDSRAPF